MMIYRYCFFIRNNTVSVWKYDGSSFTVVRKDGLENFLFEGECELWTWWKRVSHIATEDPEEFVDFCVLSDTSDDWSFKDFHFSSESIWNRQFLSRFIRDYMPDCNVILVKEGKEFSTNSRSDANEPLKLFVNGHISLEGANSTQPDGSRPPQKAVKQHPEKNKLPKNKLKPTDKASDKESNQLVTPSESKQPANRPAPKKSALKDAKPKKTTPKRKQENNKNNIPEEGDIIWKTLNTSRKNRLNK